MNLYTTKSTFLKGIALSLVIASMATTLAACGSSSNSSSSSGSSSAENNSQSSSKAADDKPFEINIMSRLGTTESPTADNMAIKEIERITNTKLNISWSPVAEYEDKINVTIASGEFPDVMLVASAISPMTAEVDAVNSDKFWKVQDYINDYEYLKQVDPLTIKNASIDGVLWGMPRTRPLVRNGFYYRTDWAAKLGISEPKNLEDLYNMLKAFVEDDPDGNGQKDTGGMAQESTLDLVFATLGPWFGLANNWDVKDGKLIPIHDEPEYLEMLKYIKRLYDDGLMNQDFPTVNSTQRDELMSDKYGLAMVSIDKGENSMGALKQIHPDADFTVQVAFADAEDKSVWGRTGYDGKYYISKDAVPDEANVKKIMEFFNQMHSPEICNLIAYGIEGKHYTKAGDNQISISDEQAALFLNDVDVIEQLGFRFTKNNYEVTNMPNYRKQYTQIFNNYDGPVLANPADSLSSTTFNEMGSNLKQIIADAGVKFVTGAIDEKGWNDAVANWHKSGGDNVTAEYQEAYDKQAK